MNNKYLKLLEKFDENSLPDLDEVVLGALELFIENPIKKIKIKNLKKPLVVGSGNAIATAKILFSNEDVIFADETNFKNKLKLKDIDGVLIFSASGEKHAPIIAKEALKYKIPIQLITCSKNSSAKKIVGSENTIITEKNREPYTYNTSTYMGWILAKTGEDPNEIYDFINKKVKGKIPKNFKDYKGFLLVLPNEFEGLEKLFNVKFVELFGRRIARDVYTYEELKHAVTVVNYNRELAIQFGEGEFDFQNDILKIPIPKNYGIGTMMAIGYFVIGHIQKQMPPYFKRGIKSYIKRLNEKSFGKGLSVIVEK